MLFETGGNVNEHALFLMQPITALPQGNLTPLSEGAMLICTLATLLRCLEQRIASADILQSG